MFTHVPRLLKLAGPMILSMSATTAMLLIDAAILARHSGDAVAAIGPAGMAVILFQGFFFGTAGYAGTFVAHSFGRGDDRGVLTSAWLGVHASIISGFLALLVAWPISRLFHFAGHAPAVTRNEEMYFLMCMAGSFFPIFGGALAGWLSGTGKPALVTAVSFVSIAINALLAWGLVLGEFGLPRMGIAGAAWATITAQMAAALLYAVLFAGAGGFSDSAARRFDKAEFLRFLSLATPAGLRISGELVAWTLFLVVVGRLGTVELAASSIAFRINSLAFFPAVGLGQAAGVLVGHARGAGDDDDVPAIAWQSLAVCEVWMVLMACVFSLASAQLVAAFAGGGPESLPIVRTGSLLMKFIAFYCVFDAANVMIGCVLSSGGDTRWVARTFFLCSFLFVALLTLVSRHVPSLMAEWSLATLFVTIMAGVWTIRFQSGAWRRIRVLRDA